MTTFTEGLHPAEYLVSEANGYRSRNAGTLASGNDLDTGTVLGIVAASGKYTELAPAAADGSETAVAILFAPVDASAADAPCAVTDMDAEVQASLLAWPSGITAPQKATALAQLQARGIKAR